METIPNTHNFTPSVETQQPTSLAEVAEGLAAARRARQAAAAEQAPAIAERRASEAAAIARVAAEAERQATPAAEYRNVNP